MKKITAVLVLLAVIVGCKNENRTESSTIDTTKNERAREVALANGYEDFQDVKQLSFTFNVKVNDTVRSQRAWTWYPEENRVELTENGETRSYVNDGSISEEEKSIDQKFINDTYWFLFPYQLMWSDYELLDNGTATAPISGTEMEQLTVAYPGEGGYTPGDKYHLYIDEEEDQIREWTYESSTGRTMSTTWEDYETFNGILLSQMHKSEDGSFQLYFTDIEVEKD